MPENCEHPTQRDGSLFLVGVFGIRSFSHDMKPARRVEDGARLFIFFPTARQAQAAVPATPPRVGAPGMRVAPPSMYLRIPQKYHQRADPGGLNFRVVSIGRRQWYV